jgi:hypothetical protein
MCMCLVDTFRSPGGGAEVQSQLAMEYQSQLAMEYHSQLADCSMWAVRRAAIFCLGDRYENLYDGGEAWSLYMIL